MYYDDNENDEIWWYSAIQLSINAPDTFQWQLREDISAIPNSMITGNLIKERCAQEKEREENEWGQ